MQLVATLLDSIWKIEQVVITITTNQFYMCSELGSIKASGTS